MKLALRTVGTGSRTAALLHGASMSGEVWRDMTPFLLEHDLTLILVDQRGHGDSPRADSYDIAEFAADLVENLPTDLDFLIGQSLGGFSGALAAPALRPKRFIGLDPALGVNARNAAVLYWLGPLQPKMPDWMLHALGSPPEGAAPDTMERVRAMWSKWDSSMMHQLVRSGRRRLFSVGPPAVPSTIVLADPSFAVPPKMAEGLREAGWDVRVKPGGIHDLHVQDPKGVVEILSDVLAGVPA